ncbi:ferredoxin [Kitasatospora phosalacinea]|uniref:ferredoxin n=1 Tax=Kitasatospora phosalacinea TaxID=2065 RepID=UPI00364A6676
MSAPAEPRGTTVRVDGDTCQGYALCHAMAPEVYEVEEDSGFNVMGEFTVPAALRPAAARGAAACPEHAITLLSRTEDQ